MMFMILNILLVLILISTAIAMTKTTTDAVQEDAFLQDAYGRRYPLFFHTTFGAGSQVDYRLHVSDKSFEKEFQEIYSEKPLFEICYREGSYYFLKKDQDIDICILRGNSSTPAGDKQEPLYHGTEIHVCLDSGHEFRFIFEIRGI